MSHPDHPHILMALVLNTENGPEKCTWEDEFRRDSYPAAPSAFHIWAPSISIQTTQLYSQDSGGGEWPFVTDLRVTVLSRYEMKVK